MEIVSFPQLQFSRVLEDVVDAIGVCGTPYGASRGWRSRR
jgi:hypothetical protein